MRNLLYFDKKFALKYPVIIQAPMAGGITTPELVASVSNKNSLGSFATGYLSTDQVKSGIQRIKALTKNPFAVNLFIPNKAKKNIEQVKSYQKALAKFKHDLGIEETHDELPDLSKKDNFNEIIDVILAEKIKIVSFTFGNLPTNTIQTLKNNDTFLIGTATSLEEGKILADSGIDAVVAQGYEAGGHRGSFLTSPRRSSTGTMALLPQMVKHISLPIIASGGIMNGSGIMSAIALGASAVQMGTAFLATAESGANPTYKKELVKLKDCDLDMTCLTKVYSGKLARGIDTEFIQYMETHVSSIPPYPITNTLSGPVRKEAVKKHATNIMSMWAGQGVPLIKDGLTAAQLLDQLENEIQDAANHVSKITCSGSDQPYD